MTTRLLADYAIVPGDGPELMANPAIDIDDSGRIIAALPESDIDASGAAAEPANVHRIGGLLMPGLVNAHAHGPMTLVRSAGDGLPLQQWLTDAVWPREGQMTPDDVVVGQTLASIEMLLAGVTTSIEMYLFEESVAEAIRRTGARGQVMAGIISAIAPDEAAFQGRLDAVAAFHGSHHDPDSGLSVGLGPHSVYDLGRERLAQVAERCAALDATLHIHLEETQAERDQVLAEHGVSATQLLADVGALDGRVVAAHGVWLDAADQALLGQANATVVHCPQSNLKLGSGIAPIVDLLNAGVQIALGTDGAASNDDLDLWEELRLAPLLARGTSHDPTALSTARAFELATSAGASAIGLDDVGALRAGAWADIVRLDLDHPSFMPGLDADLISHVVWAGGARHVTDVWVAGRQVVADREITTVDRHQVQSEARTIGARLAAAG
jgi:5-methylthioadenosine/S-adenosylhomocysteine deaminase